MYNYVFLVGRLVRDLEVRKTESGHEVATMTLAVSRPFKNPQTNQYETDFLNVSLWEPVVNNVAEYSHKGDLLALKGRIQVRKEEHDGKNIYTQQIVAERVIFLSSSNKTQEE